MGWLPAIVTRSFARTAVAVTVAYVAAYYPFAVTCSDHLFGDRMGWWPAFADSVEQALASAIAVAAAGWLTYYECEKDERLDNIAGLFASITAIGAIFLIFSFTVVHNPINKIAARISSGGALAHWTLAVIVGVTISAFLTVLQIRRVRDIYVGGSDAG
jgi:hypothetical protein